MDMQQVDFGYVDKDGCTIYKICFQKYESRNGLKRQKSEWSKMVTETEMVFDFLVEQGIIHGFDVDSILEIPDSSGQTCFDLASRCSERICNWMIDRGITVNTEQEHQTDDNSSDSLSGQKIQIQKVQTPKYVDDCYSTERKVCFLVVITEFDKPEWDRDDAENDAKLATAVLERREFEVIELVGKVTKSDFTRKLDVIKKRKDIDLFMLVVSSHGDDNDNVMFSDNENWDDKDSRLILLVTFSIFVNIFH